ncbi:MAG: protocatechuate 3,4-dioxygenase [Chloroflexi bacterium]|nr:protocatechuate 3,4-dioxygenase [Chloroflexota bacterium]
MAKIVLGVGTSHGPQLTLSPDQWWRRAEADRRNPELWFHGRPYGFADLKRERGNGSFEKELGLDKAKERFDACQRAIETLADVVERVSPDVAVVVGDDQHEAFLDDNMPAISVYWGDGIENAGLSEYQDRGERSSPGLIEAARGHLPPEHATYPGEPSLGRHILESLIGQEFDVAHSRKLPVDSGRLGGIGHAFGFVYRRIMRDEVIPNVPIFLNTYYPPNQPTMRRCYNLGRALRRAVESWDSDKTVAVIASGGLSHFVIEEDLDRQIIEGLKQRDEKLLTGHPDSYFNSGTSEIRNWVVVAGALEESDFAMTLTDYVPCYRSEAGTGCAMAFAHWA